MSQNTDRPDMSPNAKALFDAFSPTGQQYRALADVTNDEAPEPIALQMKRSLTAQACAELFAKLEQATVGIPAEDRKPLNDLPKIARDRCVTVAERAVKWLDPDFRVRCAEAAVQAHLDDHFAGLWPSDKDVEVETERARSIIGLFLKEESIGQ